MSPRQSLRDHELGHSWNIFKPFSSSGTKEFHRTTTGLAMQDFRPLPRDPQDSNPPREVTESYPSNGNVQHLLDGFRFPAPPVCRVLIVEDNPDGRESLQTLLSILGYQTDVAEDGR